MYSVIKDYFIALWLVQRGLLYQSLRQVDLYRYVKGSPPLLHRTTTTRLKETQTTFGVFLSHFMHIFSHFVSLCFCFASLSNHFVFFFKVVLFPVFVFTLLCKLFASHCGSFLCHCSCSVSFSSHFVSICGRFASLCRYFVSLYGRFACGHFVSLWLFCVSLWSYCVSLWSFWVTLLLLCFSTSDILQVKPRGSLTSIKPVPGRPVSNPSLYTCPIPMSTLMDSHTLRLFPLSARGLRSVPLSNCQVRKGSDADISTPLCALCVSQHICRLCRGIGYVKNIGCPAPPKTVHKPSMDAVKIWHFACKRFTHCITRNQEENKQD